jgi:hypothetical protein
LTDFGEAFAWMTKDPGWIGKIVIVGLLGIIPIVGQINLLGWTLASLDNLRAGRVELAPAGLSHVGRGGRLFLVLLLYGLVLAVVAAVFYVPGVALTIADPRSGGAVLGSALTAIGGLVVFLLSLGFAWIQPILYLRADRGGMGAALDFSAVLADLQAQPFRTLLAALLMYVGSLIGAVGFLLCLVGAVFTVPYGYAMVAGVLRVYEQQLSTSSPQPI